MTTHTYGPELEAAIRKAGWKNLEFDPESGTLYANEGDEVCLLHLRVYCNSDLAQVESEEWEENLDYNGCIIPTPSDAQQAFCEVGYEDGYEDGYDGDQDPDEYDDPMDGDFDSGMASAGHGTDESYGCYGGDDDY